MASELDGAVGLEGEVPAALVDEVVVPAAEWEEVRQVGPPDGVPPGLSKKPGGLPPGQAKKL